MNEFNFRRGGKTQAMAREVKARLDAGESVRVIWSDGTDRTFDPGDEFPPADMKDERPETVANRQGKPWDLAAVVHEVRNALVPAKHHLDKLSKAHAPLTPAAKPTPSSARAEAALCAVVRILDMADAIAKQLDGGP